MDTGMLQNHPLWAVWCWCLLQAAHKETTISVGYQQVVLLPGEFVFGRHKASAALSLSERTIRTCLDSLKKRKQVTIKTTNKFSIVSIIKWETYQGLAEENDQQNDQQSVQPTTSKRPASDQQATTNKNANNLKNEKNDKEVTPLPPTGGSIANCPYSKIQALYLEALPELPAVPEVTEKLKKTVLARWKEHPDLAWWSKYFAIVRECDWLMGRTKEGWLASFAWLVGPNNMANVLGGKYASRTKAKHSGADTWLEKKRQEVAGSEK